MSEKNPGALTLSDAASAADADPQETREWIDALEGVIAQEGADRAHFLIEKLIVQAREDGIDIPYSANTEYINTIPADQQPKYPGNADMEIKINTYVRWNAMIMVVRANKDTNVGGHIASFASAAALYDVGFSHFWRSINDPSGGDLIFFQGHSVPGVYSRAFMLGRLSEEQMDNFRQETGGKGISSYPHPWLMPDFWQFPTVSMGLGPIQAIYQARFMKYLDSRGLAKAGDRKVWAFLGDGETDEVESLGAIGMAGREKLDNLIFVINCNLQRLDGPVRGNGKIIQELESEFRGAGWNVIKLVWGTHWDALLQRDKKGILKRRMMDCVDGEYQTFKAKNGAYVREYFFNTPELKALVEDWTDDEIWQLNRGGHDIFKIYSAYQAAVRHEGAPSVLVVAPSTLLWLVTTVYAIGYLEGSPNRSRFVLEAVTREIARRRREALRASLSSPHPESLLVAEAGVPEWGRSLPAEDVEGLLEPSQGRRVRWVDGKGWTEPKR